jgi:hypothetical protein
VARSSNLRLMSGSLTFPSDFSFSIIFLTKSGIERHSSFPKGLVPERLRARCSGGWHSAYAPYSSTFVISERR